MTPVRVALLRGINLARRRRVPMAELRGLLEREGHANVRTHLQSGNVILESELSPARLERDLARSIGAGFGFEVPVVVRTAEELAEIVRRDPLGDVADDPGATW